MPFEHFEVRNGFRIPERIKEVKFRHEDNICWMISVDLCVKKVR